MPEFGIREAQTSSGESIFVLIFRAATSRKLNAAGGNRSHDLRQPCVAVRTADVEVTRCAKAGTEAETAGDRFDQAAIGRSEPETGHGGHHLPKCRPDLPEGRRTDISTAQRIEMSSDPVGLQKLYLGNCLAEAVMDRLRQPDRSPVAQDLHTIGVTALRELNVIQENENIGFRNLVEIAEPGQVIRLMDRDDHGAGDRVRKRK